MHSAPVVHSAPLFTVPQQHFPVQIIHSPPAPVVHSAPVPVIHSVPAPSIPSSQFHAQDEFGQHSFGYQNENSARVESKDALGVTRGSYQYVDANGVLQTTTYIADPVNGFRVAATNIPVAVANPTVAIQEAVMETPEVAAARAEHLAAHAEAIAQGAAEE